VAHGPADADHVEAQQEGEHLLLLLGEQRHRVVIEAGDDGLHLPAGERPFAIGLRAQGQRAQADGQGAQALGRATGHAGLGPQPVHERQRCVAGPDAGGLQGSGGGGDAGIEAVAQGQGLDHRVVITGDLQVFDCRRQVRQHGHHRTPVRSMAQPHLVKYCRNNSSTKDGQDPT